MHRKGSMGLLIWRPAKHNGEPVWVRWWRVGDRLRPEISLVPRMGR